MSVTSKEKGLTALKLFGTQRYFLQEIVRQLSEGIHFFYVLKARQQGITTIGLALDLYWLTINRGVQGTFVVEEQTKLAAHRSTLDGYIKSLPKGLRVPLNVHNRNLLEFKNRSRLIYQAAGTRVKGHSKTTFGQSVGINYVHGTEMASWADPAAVNNFISSLAESNPMRLYFFESTAKGFNDFEARWKDAKNSVSRGTIFIGWWRMENYAIGPDDPDKNRRLIWDVYGQEPPMGDELLWIDAVKEYYGYDITQRQLAWWRWKLEEEMGGDELSMFQNYPPTEDHAFQMDGYNFFDLKQLNEARKEAREYDEPKYYRYNFGGTYEDTNLIECSPRFAQLKVWEEADPNGYYVIGADPAFGANENSDRFCIQVLRCFTNKLVQVAEYCTTEASCYTFAWVIAHLCGWYRNKNLPSVMILEITGPGKNVMDEFHRLQQYPSYMMANAKSELHNVVSSIQNYLYSRSDSVGGGQFNYHWQTNQNLKEYVMHLFRDTFDARKLVLRSWDEEDEDSLIGEMRHIQKTADGIESATRVVHDDRVMAMALAIEGWWKMLLPDLMSMGISWESYNNLLSGIIQTPTGVLGHQLSSYLRYARLVNEDAI